MNEKPLGLLSELHLPFNMERLKQRDHIVDRISEVMGVNRYAAKDLLIEFEGLDSCGWTVH